MDGKPRVNLDNPVEIQETQPNSGQSIKKGGMNVEKDRIEIGNYPERAPLKSKQSEPLG